MATDNYTHSSCKLWSARRWSGAHLSPCFVSSCRVLVGEIRSLSESSLREMIFDPRNMDSENMNWTCRAVCRCVWGG